MEGLETPRFCACTQAQILVLPQTEEEVQKELYKPGGKQNPQLEIAKHWVLLRQAHSNVL